jgi:hypothetical protein
MIKNDELPDTYGIPTYVLKDNYNIDYVINILKTLLVQIEKNKLNPNMLSFTLTDSIGRLLAYLEVEKGRMR